MTKESKDLITEICRNKLWLDEDEISTPEVFEFKFGNSQDSFVVCKRFESAEDGKEYMKKINELQSIRVKASLEWGNKGEKYTLGGNLFGEQMYLGKDVYVEVNRILARAVFEAPYFGPNGMCDFITYFSRDKGKYWDDLLSTHIGKYIEV